MKLKASYLALAAGLLGGLATPAHAVSLLIDFGGAAFASPVNGQYWNTITDAVAGSVADALDADTGSATGIGVAVTSRFNGTNTNGDTGSVLYASGASGDSFFGNTSEFSGITVPTAQVTLSGLDPLLAYNLTFYGSRMGVGDNRETQYDVTGAGMQTVLLDVANNDTDTTVTAFGAVPDGSNQIVLDVSPGPANTNGTGFYYLGVLEVTSIPEPSVPLLLGVAVAGLALVRRRR